MLVIPCTGRTNAEMPRALIDLPQVRYCIMANGAKVLRMEDQKLLFSDCLDRKTAGQAISFASRYRCMCELYMDGNVFVEQHKLKDLTAYGVTPRLKELADTIDLGSIVNRRAGSSPVNRSIKKASLKKTCFL